MNKNGQRFAKAEKHQHFLRPWYHPTIGPLKAKGQNGHEIYNAYLVKHDTSDFILYSNLNSERPAHSFCTESTQGLSRSTGAHCNKSRRITCKCICLRIRMSWVASKSKNAKVAQHQCWPQMDGVLFSLLLS
jgi:hypothetical protein